MKLWKKLAAVAGASALLFALFGTALAATAASDQGVVPTWHDGNITAAGDGQSDGADCDADDAIETGDAAGDGESTNGVSVAWTYDAQTKEFGFTATDGVVLIAYVKGGDAYNEYDYSGMGGVDSDGGMFAPDNGSTGPAGLSHAVFCTGPSETETSSSSTTTTTTTASTTTASTTTNFSQTVSGTTDDPSEPNTASVEGGSNAGNSAWLLIAMIGVVAGSAVVLKPSRVKNDR
jgi:uncharacterized low-complexity protein